MKYSIEYCSNTRGGFAMDAFAFASVEDCAAWILYDRANCSAWALWDYAYITDEAGNEWTIYNDGELYADNELINTIY